MSQFPFLFRDLLLFFLILSFDLFGYFLNFAYELLRGSFTLWCLVLLCPTGLLPLQLLLQLSHITITVAVNRHLSTYLSIAIRHVTSGSDALKLA
jgi:hypothetical protein